MAVKDQSWQKNLTLSSCLVYMLTMILAVGLKYHYSIASAADLKWILRPTATLVEIITGNSYIFEKGTGYINKEIGIIIAKSCAGVNFLIIVFGMSVFTVLHHLKSHWIKYSTFLGSLICAFLLTISVNTIRIIGAIKLFQMEGTILWLNRSEIHRLEGIIFYFLFLYLFYLALKSIIFRYQYAQEK